MQFPSSRILLVDGASISDGFKHSASKGTMNHAFRRLPRQFASSIIRTRPQRSCLPICRAGILAYSQEAKARALNQKGLDEEEQKVKVRAHQVKRPWHREGADKPLTDSKGQEVQPTTKGTSRIFIIDALNS